MIKCLIALIAIVSATPALAYAQISSSEIERHLTADGYRVMQIERYDRTFEVRAFDKGGACMELHIDSSSGQIVHRESDNRCAAGRVEDHGGRHGGRHGGGHHGEHHG